MSSNGSEKHIGKVYSAPTTADIEAFFADFVLNDYDGVHLESIGQPISKLGDGMVDPNPARQEPLYQATHENADINASQLPPR
jgi:hypothetical protein